VLLWPTAAFTELVFTAAFRTAFLYRSGHSILCVGFLMTASSVVILCSEGGAIGEHSLLERVTAAAAERQLSQITLTGIGEQWNRK
jgi:hypothetical protein